MLQLGLAILWLSIGIGAYVIYNKYQHIMEPGDTVGPTGEWFAICILTAPVHLLIIPSILVFQKVNSFLGIEYSSPASFVDKIYKVVSESGVEFRSCSPIRNNNVIQVISVRKGSSDRYTKLQVKRVDSISSGNQDYFIGDTYLESLKDGIRSGALRELSGDEKILLSIS